MATNPDAADRARAAQAARLAKEAKTRRAIVAGSLASFVAALGLVSLTGSPATTEAEPALIAQIEETGAPVQDSQKDASFNTWSFGDDSDDGGDSQDESWGDSDDEERADDEWQEPQQKRRAHARTRSS